MALPDIPDSWNKLIDKILQVVVLLVASYGAITGHNTANRVDTVQQHQEANSTKLDDVKTEAATAAKKASEVEKKTDAIKDKADKIGAKVGADGMK